MQEEKPSARQILCASYSACLSSSIRKSSTGFNCERCECFHPEPIPEEEFGRCGALLATVFFRSESVSFVDATCPRCGKTHRCRSCPGGSTRRFCQPCLVHMGSTMWGEAEGIRPGARSAVSITAFPAGILELVAELDPDPLEETT